MATEAERRAMVQAAAGVAPGPSVSGEAVKAAAASLGLGGSGDSPSSPPDDSRALRVRQAASQALPDQGPPVAGQLPRGSSWPAAPDQVLTPGAVTKPTDKDFDGYWHNGTVAHSMRNVPDDEKARIASRYGIPRAEWGAYEFDHQMPLSAGGSNAEGNVWPEPKPSADEKDRLEWQVYGQLHRGEITQEEALAKIKAFRPSGPQGRLVSQDDQGRQINRYLGQILPGEQYQQSEGMVGHVLDALDFPRNVWSSALKGAKLAADATYDGEHPKTNWDMLRAQAEGALMYGKQAFNKQRHTSMGDSKDMLAEIAGLGKVRFGKDDGKFQWGDVADIGSDLAVGVMTDPLTLLTEGATTLTGKGGLLARGAAEAKAGIDSVDAGRYLAATRVGRAAVGAGLGYASADQDAPWYEKAALAIGGGATGALNPEISGAVRGAVEKGGDALVNAYATLTRGNEFGGVAQASQMATKALERARGLANWIRQGRQEALAGLDEAERQAATDTMHELKNATVQKRNDILDQMGMKQGFDGYDQAFNKATNKANDFVTQEVMPQLIEEKFGQNPQLKNKVIDAVNQWADHNENVMGRLNKEIYKRTPDAIRAGSEVGVPGLRYHVDDVLMARSSAEAENLLDMVAKPEIQAKMAATTAEDAAKSGLSPDQSYAVYAEKFAKHFLDDQEHEAIKLMREYKNAAVSGPVRAWETGLRGYDAMTNFAKANMLYFSTSWLRTQFFDNMSKAFVEGGLPGMARSAWDATAGSVTSKMGQDVRALLRGDVSHLFTDADLKEAMQLGIIHDGMYKSLSNDATRQFLYAPQEFKQNVVAQGYRAVTGVAMKNPIVKTINSVGSYMEGAGRIATYRRVRDALVESGVNRELAMKVAAHKVEEIFFNYSNVTAFENAVAKRLMPFYTFYSKNLPYWAKAALDPEKVGRVAALDKVRQAIGTTPTKSEDEGMTPYIRQNAPRKLGKDDQGNTRYLVSPVDPRVEALKMVDPKNVVETLKERGNPLLKTGYELATGKDTFTDDKLLPSQTEKGRKYLFSRGYLHYAINELLKKMGATDPLGVHVDARGNPYTTKDSTVIGDRLMDVLMPHGFLDQAASAIGKDAAGKEAPGVSAMNRLNPYQTVAVSPEFQRMARKRNAEKEGKK